MIAREGVRSTAVHRRRSTGRSLLAAGLAPLVLLACGPSEPKIEVKTGEGWGPAPLFYDRVEGGREAERTKASFFFTAADSSWLEMRIAVTVDPQPKLSFGRWYYEQGAKETTGSVRAEHLRFLGGQGGRPSIGGEFVLREGGEARFRVLLPPIEIQTSGR